MLKELEKVKEKERYPEVIDGEGDESDVKIKEKWFGKQNRKEDETCGKENEIRKGFRKMIKEFGNRFKTR